MGNKLKMFLGGNHTPGLGKASPSGLAMSSWPQMSNMNPAVSHSGMITRPPKGLGRVPSPKKSIL